MSNFTTISRNSFQNREEFHAALLKVKISNMSRRIMRMSYRASKQLARTKRLQRLLKSKLENFEIRQQVRTLKAAKRTPAWRVRRKDEMATIRLPPIRWTYNYGYVGKVLQANYVEGQSQVFQDYNPIARLDPPRNITVAQRLRVYSSSAAIEYSTPGVSVSMQKSKWAYFGLLGYSFVNKLNVPLVWTQSEANAALLKVQAKVYEADIQMNEYLFEWKQVFRLLKDPFRTILKFHKTLERWTRRDAWIYLPKRYARKCYKGKLIMQRPTGAVLMSMRTKKFLSVELANDAVVREAANRWLQYRYGIAPLAMDITKVIQMWSNPRLFFPKKTASARNWISRTKVERDYAYNVAPLNFKFHTTLLEGSYYSVKQWYDLLEEPPMLYKLGVHPSQWLKALWNGLPYSFVADWIVNIDDWLAATTDVPWIKLGANVVTAKEYSIIKTRCLSVGYNSTGNLCKITPGLPVAVKSQDRMYRNIDFPRVTEPTVSRAWQSVKNAITGLALIYQPLIKRNK